MFQGVSANYPRVIRKLHTCNLPTIHVLVAIITRYLCQLGTFFDALAQRRAFKCAEMFSNYSGLVGANR